MSHYSENKQYYKDKARARDALVKPINRKFIVDYLKQHPCIDCGETDIEVLQFDHRDQSSKVKEVSRLLQSSQRRILEEIEKCDVRCANCHLKRTRRQLGWWTSDSL